MRVTLTDSIVRFPREYADIQKKNECMSEPINHRYTEFQHGRHDEFNRPISRGELS